MHTTQKRLPTKMHTTRNRLPIKKNSTPQKKTLPENLQLPPPRPDKKAIIDKETTHKLREQRLKEKSKKSATPENLQLPPPRPDKRAIIDKETTRKLREQWLKKKKGLKIHTTRKRLPTKKDSTPEKISLLERLQIPQKPLNKEEAKLLKADLENEEKRILRQFKISKDKFSKCMQDVYTLLCKNFATYDDAIEYFEKYIYKEITDKVASGDYDHVQ